MLILLFPKCASTVTHIMLYSVYWKGDTDELRAMVYRLGTKRLAKTDRQTPGEGEGSTR